MMSGAQNQKQFRNWLKFSYRTRLRPRRTLKAVLQRQNVMSDAKRFAHAKKVAVQSKIARTRPVEDRDGSSNGSRQQYPVSARCT